MKQAKQKKRDTDALLNTDVLHNDVSVNDKLHIQQWSHTQSITMELKKSLSLSDVVAVVMALLPLIVVMLV